MRTWLLETYRELEYHTVTYIQWHITVVVIDTIDSPDDEHLVARNI